MLAVPEAHDERRVPAGADHEARLVLVHRQQGEGAVQATDDRAERGDEVTGPPVLAAEQDRRDAASQWDDFARSNRIGNQPPRPQRPTDQA